jgi:RNA polymerase sigma factor (sigma-70 family)
MFSSEFDHASQNRDSFEVLYMDYFTPIYRYVFFRIADRESVMDIVQTVFLKAFQSKDSIDSDRALAYLYTIARNSIIDFYRKKHAVSLQDFDDYIQMIADKTILNPEQEGVRSDNKTYIYQLLDHLSQSEKDVVIMKCLQELSYSEIAEILGKSEEAIRQIQSRALKKLKQLHEQ